MAAAQEGIDELHQRLEAMGALCSQSPQERTIEPDVVIDSESPRVPQEYVLATGSTVGSKRLWASGSWQQLHASGTLVHSDGRLSSRWH